MKRMKQYIGIILTFLLIGSNLPGLAAGKSKLVKSRDIEYVSYICSFDIFLDETFSGNPVYNYAEDGLLHVTVYDITSEASPIFEFGNKNRLATISGMKSDGTWGHDGEWELSSPWTSWMYWDEVISTKVLSNPNGGSCFGLTNYYWENFDLEDRIGEPGDNLSVDMIEEDDELIIRMYRYNSKDVSLSGVVKPSSTIAEYIPSSFREARSILSDGTLGRRTLFKQNGKYANAIEGTEEAAALEQKRQDLLASLTDPTETKVVEYEREDPELIENIFNKKDETTDTENNKTEEPETTSKDIPETHQGLSKEESIEKYGYYYDESAKQHICFFYDGINNGLQFKNEPLNKFEFTVPGNFAGVSSDGKTKFTIYHIGVRQYIVSTGKMRPIPLLKLTLMQASGNLGEKMYQGDSHVWHIPDTVTVFGFPDLDNQSAIYGWNEVVDITDEYVDTIQGEEGDFAVRYTNDARTGIESITFDLPGFSKTIPFEQIDYIGGFLQFFLPSAYGDTWADKAVEIGLTPQESEAE